MWQVVKQNPKGWHFLAYCLSFIVYGGVITGLGPLIPYLAEQQSVPQTQYSFFFLSRTIGFVVGAILVKFIEKCLSFHNTLMIFSTLIFGTFALFSFSRSMTMQGVYLFFGSVVCAVTQIVLNIALLTAHVGPHQQFYVQIGHGMFGVGGFFSPFVVLFFEQRTYFVLGLLMFIIVPFYYFLQTPEASEKLGAQMLQAGNLADQMKRISQRFSHQSEDTLLRKLNKKQQSKTTLIYLISFLFFIYIGQEVTYGGWISSYAVLEHVATKEGATVYSSLFWTFMTLFRFILAFIMVKPSKKLKALIYLQLITTAVVIVMVEYLAMTEIAIYFASIMYGVSFSAMFGLFFVLPSEYGVEVTCEEGSSFLLYGQLGEGMISMIGGYLMSWFTPNMIWYSILMCGILLLWTSYKIVSVLSHQQEIHSREHQMKEMISYETPDHK